eukprot:3938973-Pleurochrysis_carterae.AAC.1
MKGRIPRCSANRAQLPPSVNNLKTHQKFVNASCYQERCQPTKLLLLQATLGRLEPVVCRLVDRNKLCSLVLTFLAGSEKYTHGAAGTLN